MTQRSRMAKRFALCNEGEKLCSDPYCMGHSQTQVVDTKTGLKMLISHRSHYRDYLALLNFAVECLEFERSTAPPTMPSRDAAEEGAP